MNCYAIKALIPKNANSYFNYLKSTLLRRCEEMNEECVIEIIDGRIILFTSAPPNILLKGVKGIKTHYPVRIFEDFDTLIHEISVRLNNCGSFAIRSNRKVVEQEIGARIVDLKKIRVDLDAPECEILVEKRGKFYILFL